MFAEMIHVLFSLSVSCRQARILVPAQDMVDQLGDERRQDLLLLLVEGLSITKKENCQRDSKKNPFTKYLFSA